MPKLARDYSYNNNLGYERYYPRVVTPVRPQVKPLPKKRVLKRKKVNPFQRLISLALLCAVGIYVLPYGFQRISKPLLFGAPYKEVKVDTYNLLAPTTNYLSNDIFMNRRMLTSYKAKPLMTQLYATSNLPKLEKDLQTLMLSYKSIDPSIFVWDYDSGRYADIKASKSYSVASIIKIPVLIQLFKSIEANQLTIYDEMPLTNYYKAPGSGDLQYKQSGVNYTMDELAKKMIQVSDNSATNMLMSAVGGMPDVNAGIRSWGLKHTQIDNWLPDMEGTNFSTAKDLATMLYNLDNPGFLNINSREYIIDYMSNVENNRLIQAGLGEGALFVHKTGDIGKMLGDAGIVYAPTGKKYIVVILANRPYNSPMGSNFIQKASEIIYNNVISGAR